MKQYRQIPLLLAVAALMLNASMAHAQGCAPQALPIVEDFQDCGAGNADAFPACWSRAKNYDNQSYPYVMSYSGQRVMRMYSGTLEYHYSLLILPEADVEDISGCFLRFDVLPESYYTKVEVGVCDDTTLMGHNFTPVQTLDLGSTSGSWQNRIVPLSAYQGSGKFVAIRFAQSLQNYTGTYLRIDNVVLNTCGIESLSASHCTHESARLTFTTFGNPTVDLEYGPQGFAAGSGVTVSGVTSPCTVHNLAPATVYTFRLIPTCAGTPFPQGERSVNATTLSDHPGEIPFCSDFPSQADFNAHWMRYGGTSNWSNNSNDYHRGAGGYVTGYNTTAYLVSPRFADTLGGLQVGFWARDNNNYTNRTIQLATTNYPNQLSTYHYLRTVTIDGGEWRRYTVSLSGADTSDRYIVVRTNATSTYLSIDEIAVSPCLPYNVRVYGVTDHEATISWEGPEAIAVSVDSTTHILTSSPATLTGLPAGSSLTLYVQGACDDAGCPEPFTIQTLEMPEPVPYCQEFETTPSGQLPEGWIAPYYYDGCPQVFDNSNYAFQGTRSLRLYSYRSSSSTPSIDNYAVMPLLGEEDLTSLYVSFRTCVKDYGYSDRLGVIEVGVMTNPYDTSTFVPVGSYSFGAANTWYFRNASLASYAGTGRYLAFRYRMNYNGYSYARCHIDHLRVCHSYISDCAVNANLTDTSVTINWRTVPAGSPVSIQVGGTSVDVYDDSTYTFTGLTPGTNYTFYMSTIDGVSCSNEIWPSARTLSSNYELPYCEDFESYSSNATPANWTRVVTNGSYPRLWNNSTMTVDFGATNGQNIFALPALAGDVRDAIVQFRYRHYHSGTMLIVGVMDVPQSSYLYTFTPVDTLDFTGQNNNQFYDFRVSMAGYNGSGRHIAFRFVNNSTSLRNGWLDDLHIYTCALTNPRVYNITNNSATVSWEGYPSQVEGDVWIEYGPRNFTLGNGTRLLATSNPMNITGLDEDTDYDFVFVSNCGGGSCSHPRVPIRTMSFAFQPTLCYNFETEASGSLPEGWTRPVVYSDCPRVYLQTSMAYNSDKYLEFKTYNCGTTDGQNLAVSPLLQVDSVSDLFLTFRYRHDNANSSALMIIGVMVDPADLSTFTPVDTIRGNTPAGVYNFYSESLASYRGQGRYIAFWYKTVSCTSDNFRIDNLVISRCRIGDVGFFNITTNSADVTWNYPDADYQGSGVIIEYGTSPFAYGTGTRIAASSTPVTLDSLERGTTYYVYVAPNCDQSTDCAVEMHTFTTKDQDLVPPFCQDFNAIANGQYPFDWYRPVTYGGTPCVATDQRHTAPASLKLNAQNGSQSMAVLPLVDVDDISQTYLAFWMRMAGTDILEVGVMNSPFDTSTFTLVREYNMTTGNNWRYVQLPLASYTGTGRYVAFRFRSNSSELRSCYIDDVALRDCQMDGASVNHVTQTTAEVTWSSIGSAQGVWVEYSAVGGPDGDFTPGTGQRLFLTTPGTMITGLIPATYYSFHLWVQCDSTESDCNFMRIVIQTLHPPVAFPHCEDMEEVALNGFMNNWRRLSTYAANNPYVTTSSNQTKALRFDADSATYSIAIMPEMEASDSCSTISGKTLTFSLFTSCETPQDNAFEVGVMEDVYDASTFTPVATLHGTAGQWTQHLVSMESYTGTGSYIAFRYTTRNGHTELYLDDLCVKPCVVTGFRFTNVDQTSTTIEWDNADGVRVICEYGPTGFTPGTGDTVSLTTSPATISGLDPSTRYQFYFYSVCACDARGTIVTLGGTPGTGGGGWGWGGGWSGGGGGGWGGGGWGGSGGGGGGGGIGTTVITAPDDCHLPYCDDMESYDSIIFPIEWNRTTGSSQLYPRISDSRYHSRSHSMEFYTTASATNRYQSFACLPPQGDIAVNGVVMTFWAMANNNAATLESAGFYVGVMDNPLDTTTFTPVAQIRLNSANHWEEQIVNFSSYTGTGRYIAFKYAPHVETYNTYVDDIYLGYCAVSDVQYSNATGSSIDVAWTGHNTPSSVVVQYGPQGFLAAGNSGTTLVCTSNPFTITGLDNEQSYDFYLRAVCNDTMEACDQKPFTLNPSIVAPYCENFDGILPDQQPDYWIMRSGQNGYEPKVAYQNDNGYLTFNAQASTTGNRYAILPPLRGDAVSDMVVSFRARMSSNTYTRLDIGVVTDTNDMATFQTIATVWCDASNAWQPFVVPLASYQGTGDRIAFKAYCTSSWRQCDIDDLVINHFVAPTGISVHNLSSERVLLTWNHDPGRTAPFVVSYGRPGFGLGTSVTATGDSAILAGLQPGTEYEFYFSMGNHINDCQRYTFTTLEKHTLPYCEDFEGCTGNGSLPEGWTRFGNCNSWYSSIMPLVQNGVRYSGNYAMEIRFSNSSGQYAYAVLPEFDNSNVSDLNISMMVDCEGYSSQKKLVFGVMEDLSDYNSFVPCDTMLFSSSEENRWVMRTASLHRYQGQGRYLAFQYVATTGNHGFRIDDIKVESFAHPTITAGPDNDVIINVPGATTVDYYIEYGRQGFELGHGTTVHITTNPASIEGLPTHGVFDFYALASPGDISCYDPVRLTIQELPRTPIPYCENFDQLTSYYTLPEGWTRVSNSTNFPGSYPGTYYVSANNSIRFESNGQMVILPPMEVDSVKRLNLQLKLHYNQSNYGRRIVVGVLNSRGDLSTFVPIDTLYHEPTTSDVVVCNTHFANYQGNGRFIALKYLCNSNQPMHIDDLILDLCPAPQVTYHDYNTVKIATAVPNPDFYIEYGPASNPRANNQLVHVTASPYYLSGLQSNTTYRFWPQCDSTIGSSCYSYTAITTSARGTLPFCENFEGLSNYGYPATWVKLPADNYNDYVRATTSSYANASNHGLEFYNCSNTNYASNGFAVLPELDIDSIQKLTISMDVRPQSNGYFEIGVMTDPHNRNTYTPVAQLSTPNAGNWNRSKVSLASYAGTGKHIAIRFNHTSGCGWGYIDNVIVEECSVPVNVQAYLSGHNQVTVSWQDNQTDDFWVEYGTQGFAQGEGTFVRATQSPLVIDSLEDLTTYQFYLRCDSSVATCRPSVAIATSTSLSVPYCEGFESYGTSSSSYPAHWFRHPYGNDNYYLHTSSTAQAGSRGLYFYASANTAGNNSYAVLPDLEIEDISDVTVCFHYYGASNSSFQVGVMTNPYDRNTFTPVATINTQAPNQWHFAQCSLANYTGTGRFVAIRYFFNSSNSGSGYIDNLQITSCYTPINFRANTLTHNQVELSWDGNAGDFYVEYGPQGFALGEGTLLRNPANPTILTLENSTTYQFYVRCDTIATPCSAPVSAATGSAPANVPSCIDFEGYSTGIVPEGWSVIRPIASYNYVYGSTNHSGNRNFRTYATSNQAAFAILPDLTLENIQDLFISFWARSSSTSNGYLEVGVMEHANDPASFILVKRFRFTNTSYSNLKASFANYTGTGRFVAFRTVSQNGSAIYINLDDIYLSTCGATDFAVQDITDHSATFTWLQAGNPSITVEYGPQGFTPGTGTIVVSDHSPFTISNLDPLTNYTFRIDSDCPDLGASCSADENAVFNIFTPVGGTGCVDYTDLTDANVTCTYGTYANPYANLGVVDYGASSINSRHTVHYDTTATDPRTGNLLRVVPEGGSASVRLGNWGTSAEAESVTYGLAVDTAQFDLLILKYAAVLQDPAHGVSHQPRFRIQILDSDMNLIDANCGAADFIANQNLGWNVAANYVLWKDWTTVGLDLSPYAGQRIYVRLTTFDCGESTHYGYAYFTLNCMRKSMQASGCGFVAENTFTAPSGFAYRWYSSQDLDATISTQQSITVPSNNDITYFCDASFVDNANCYFTLSAFAGTRFPLADFAYTYSVENCQFHVQFQNNSTISMDGVNPLGSGEPCETAFWDFGNGLTSTAYHGATTYNSPGTYYVTLYSGLAGDACVDTLTLPITLTADIVHPVLTGPTEACQGDSVAFVLDHCLSLSGWSSGDTSRSISFVADSSLVLRAFVVDSNGCADTLVHSLLVHPIAHVADIRSVCESALPFVWQDSLSYSSPQQGEPTLLLTDRFGCDSLLYLHLSVHSSTFSTYADTIVENLLPWQFHDVTLTHDTADMPVTIRNVHDCDSTIAYSLFVWPNRAATADSTLCENFLPLVWNDATFLGDSVATILLNTTHGADSLLTMRVHVDTNTHYVLFDTLVENLLPYVFHDSLFSQAGTYQVTLPNSRGCDSVVTIHLCVHPNRVAEADSTLCFSSLPFVWNGHTFSLDAVPAAPVVLTQQVSLLTVHGADSLLTMRLTVLPTHDEHFSHTICNNQSFSFADSLYTLAGTYAHSLTNTYGCDSLATLHLSVNDTSTSLTSLVVCDSLVWNGTTYSASGLYSFRTLNALACDSTARLALTVHYSDTSLVEATACQRYVWHGDTLLASGLYDHRTLTTHSCDSLCLLQLTVNPEHHYAIDSVICQGDTLSFADTLLAASGVYPFAYANSFGCDSTVTLSLVVGPRQYYHISDTTCSNTPYSFLDSTYTATGLYTHPATNIYGCDSTFYLHLQVNPVSDTTISDTILENQLPYTFNGHLCLDSGTFSITILNHLNCDSVITYHLSVHRNVTTMLDSSVCEGRLPMLWDDTLFSATSLTHTKHLLTSHGADSTVVMQLHPLPEYSHAFEHTLCSDALPFSWQGFSFEADPDTLPYRYTHTLSHLLATQEGCDSLVVVTLHVNHTTTAAVAHTDCDSYAWHGQTFTSSGTYPYSLPNSLGCDSTVTLTLTLHYSDTAREDVVSCGPYLWHDQGLTTSGTYTFLTATTQGCDSLCVLNLRVPVMETELQEQACDSLRWNETLYTATGSYQQHFTTADGCDSVVTLLLTIHSSSLNPEQVTLCEADLPYQYNEISFPYGTQRGLQTIPYTDRHGCDSTILLQLDIFYNPVLRVDMAQFRCQQREFELVATHSADVDHVTWTSSPYDPTIIGQEQDNPILVSPHQPTLYTASATVPGTPCSNSLSITVGPIIDLEADLEVVPEFATPSQTEITLRDRSHGQVSAWLWSADGNPVGDQPVSSFQYPINLDSVEVTLVVTEPRFGCRDTARVIVPFRGGDLFVPNAFTPDESTNQRFLCQGRNIVSFEIDIYARNGQRVYYSVDPAEGWDGRNLRGEACPVGAYVYLIRYTTTEAPRNPITRRGTVMLLR